MQTHISATIERTIDKEKFDASVKEMLADKQILARILKHSVDDFSNEELSVIINCIGEPEVSMVGVNPGDSNPDKASLSMSEDSVLGEGTIYYDIRFIAYLPSSTNYLKFLINIEAQKSSSPSKLGYHIDNRVIYYLSRMVSSQKQVEFSNSNYDDIKPVRSIWICMDGKEDEDSINKISFTQSTIYGKCMSLDDLDKVQAIIIQLRKNENAYKSNNKLIAMLEELLRSERASTKKKRLTEDYGIVMTAETERRVNVMCNLSDVVEERGIEQGVNIGKSRMLIEMICKKIIKGKSVDEIAEALEVDLMTIQKIYEIAIKFSPDFDMDYMMKELYDL